MPISSAAGCGLMRSLRIPCLWKLRCGESCSTRSFVSSAGCGLGGVLGDGGDSSGA